VRLDVALALALLAGCVLLAAAAAPLGPASAYVLLVVFVLAARGFAGPRVPVRARERIDVVLIVGLAGLALLIADRVRQALNA
jgi:FtsH-binding integral membrane protein